MRELKLGLLGGFRLERADGQPVSVPTKKAKALLAYLALHGREPQPRAKLAHLLWEDSDEGQARESLRQALKLLRQALSPACVSALIAQGDAVVFESAALDIDVVDFHRLIETNRPQQLGSAAEQYRGQLLEGFDLKAPEFENWLATERQRLNEKGSLRWRSCLLITLQTMPSIAASRSQLSCSRSIPCAKAHIAA